MENAKLFYLNKSRCGKTSITFVGDFPVMGKRQSFLQETFSIA